MFKGLSSYGDRINALKKEVATLRTEMATEKEDLFLRTAKITQAECALETILTKE